MSPVQGASLKLERTVQELQHVFQHPCCLLASCFGTPALPQSQMNPNWSWPLVAPAPVLAPENAKNANAPSAKRAAAPVALWAVPSVPRTSPAKGHQTAQVLCWMSGLSCSQMSFYTTLIPLLYFFSVKYMIIKVRDFFNLKKKDYTYNYTIADKGFPVKSIFY